ncbi:hypothetical protein [Polaromonas sp.]|nr:hypothetical protein [Polaromonas sp.]NMM08497.1 hypothetical protein [Polaromonas sp.]
MQTQQLLAPAFVNHDQEFCISTPHAGSKKSMKKAARRKPWRLFADSKTD